MFRRGIFSGALAALALLAGTGVAGAQDTLRLGLSYAPGSAAAQADAATLTLRLDQDAETIPVWRRWGGWGGGFYRPWGYYGAHRPWGYYGAYRPWGYYGAYRPWGYAGGYRPWGYSGYYSPYAYSYYYTPSYFYTPPVYYYSTPYFFYMSAGVNGLGSVTVNAAPKAYVRDLDAQPYPDRGNSPPAVPPSEAPQREPTYPYDGGPQSPVPAPRDDPKASPNPTTTPRQPTVPLEGRAVSLPPRASPKPVYPAYGEKPARPAFAEDRVVPVPVARKTK